MCVCFKHSSDLSCCLCVCACTRGKNMKPPAVMRHSDDPHLSQLQHTIRSKRGGSHRESLTLQSRALPTPSEGLTTLPRSYQWVGLPFCHRRTQVSTSTPLYCHNSSIRYWGALPEPPFTPLSWTHPTTTHPMIGPYQTPTTPTKTHQMKRTKNKMCTEINEKKGK